MTVINHDLRSVDGKTIYHLPDIGGSTTLGNLALPNIYSESTTAKYPVGTKFVDGERVLHYAYNGSAYSLPTLRAAVGYDAMQEQSKDSFDTSQAAGIGSTTASPFKVDGVSNGSPATNGWAGMYILILTDDSVGGRVVMRIVSNKAAGSASPYTVECVLDQPLPVTVAGDTDCDIIPNRYADVRRPADLTAGMYPFLGAPMIFVSTLNYFWLQTWGPCFITANVTQPGDSAYDRVVTFRSDGSLGLLDEDVHTSQLSSQIAGYTLATNGFGSSWIMLTLDR